jgi:hypothetical protein
MHAPPPAAPGYGRSKPGRAPAKRAPATCCSPPRAYAGCGVPVRSPAANVWTSNTVRLMLSSDRPASL